MAHSIRVNGRPGFAAGALLTVPVPLVHHPTILIIYLPPERLSFTFPLPPGQSLILRTPAAPFVDENIKRCAQAGGEAAVGPSLVPQVHGGALLSGGKPGNPGHNQHTARQQAQEVRGQLIGQLEGAAKDLSAILATARESDGDRLRCKACGSFIGELRAILPAQQEHEGCRLFR